jgi:hypothetical protein
VGITLCGTLSHEGIAKQVRSCPSVVVECDGKVGHATLEGHAQISKMSWWRTQGNTIPVSIHADTFIEGKVEVHVPTGRISALGLRKDVKINGAVIGKARSVKILTREARTDFEKTNHPRWPIVVVNGNFYEWTSKDVVKGQVELPLKDKK